MTTDRSHLHLIFLFFIVCRLIWFAHPLEQSRNRSVAFDATTQIMWVSLELLIIHPVLSSVELKSRCVGPFASPLNHPEHGILPLSQSNTHEHLQSCKRIIPYISSVIPRFSCHVLLSVAGTSILHCLPGKEAQEACGLSTGFLTVSVRLTNCKFPTSHCQCLFLTKRIMLVEGVSHEKKE